MGPAYRDDASTLRAQCERLARDNARLERRVSKLVAERRRWFWYAFRRTIKSAWPVALGVLFIALLVQWIGRVLAEPVFSPSGMTRGDVQRVRQVAQLWRTTAGDACPSVQRLMVEKQFDSSTKIIDRWGTPFKIKCDDDETLVISAGPDGKFGTHDDIQAPRPE